MLMSLTSRQNEILRITQARGYASIDELAQSVGVTPQTVRRDINQLAARGLLRRTHGGAACEVSSSENTAYSMRAQLMREEKRLIAEAIARAIPNHCSLFINIGTTTEAVAHALLKHKGLKVITNNLHVAALMSPHAEIEVLLAGGKVRADGGIVGQATVDFIKQFKVDYALVGISGIDPDGSLLDFDYEEVHVSQTIICNARTVYLAADSTKFGRNALVRLGDVQLVDRVFTDAQPETAFVQLLREHKIALDWSRAQE